MYLITCDQYKYFFARRGCIYFRLFILVFGFHNLTIPSVNFFSFFLKDVHFTKRYKNTPTVIVAAHHLSSDGNLKPIHNGITTWVEVNR